MIRKRDWPTVTLWLATAASVGIALFMLWGAGLFRQGGRFLELSELENVGSFLSGVFTPLAIGWAARSFLLQRRQMLDTLAAMQEQIGIDREALMAQKMQRDEERKRDIELSDPLIKVEPGSTITSSGIVAISFHVTNLRAAAQRFRVGYKIRNSKTGLVKEKTQVVTRNLVAGQVFVVEISFPQNEDVRPVDYETEFLVLAERLDMQVSEFIFEGFGTFNLARRSYRPAVPGLTVD